MIAVPRASQHAMSFHTSILGCHRGLRGAGGSHRSPSPTPPSSSLSSTAVQPPTARSCRWPPGRRRTSTLSADPSGSRRPTRSSSGSSRGPAEASGTKRASCAPCRASAATTCASAATWTSSTWPCARCAITACSATWPPTTCCSTCSPRRSSGRATSSSASSRTTRGSRSAAWRCWSRWSSTVRLHPRGPLPSPRALP